jgi:hypothetical protein
MSIMPVSEHLLLNTAEPLIVIYINMYNYHNLMHNAPRRLGRRLRAEAILKWLRRLNINTLALPALLEKPTFGLEAGGRRLIPASIIEGWLGELRTNARLSKIITII